jgi:hypothetical protein
MTVIHLSPRTIIVGLTITTLLSSVGYASAGSLRSPQADNQISEQVQISFELPPVADNGAPGGRQKGAGSHSLCELSYQQTEIAPLIALIPKIPVNAGAQSKTYVWGRTTAAHPTFWFYVAYPQDTYVEFVLQDEEGNDLYQTVFPIEGTPGVISLTFLEEEAALTKGESYHWYFNIMCDPEDSPDDFVEGWVERVELNPVANSQLESAQSLERVSIYAANGIWYDTLTSLDRLQQIEPKNQAVATVWTDLLQQVNLDEISQEPIVRRYNLAD